MSDLYDDTVRQAREEQEAIFRSLETQLGPEKGRLFRERLKKEGLSPSNKTSPQSCEVVNHHAAQSHKALDYLDQCKDWTFEEFVKVNRIAETNTTEAELRRVWDNAVINIAPLGGQPGGKEYLRVTTRRTLAKAVDTFVSMGANRPSAEPSDAQESPPIGLVVFLLVVLAIVLVGAYLLIR
jgi:hypothetical protein